MAKMKDGRFMWTNGPRLTAKRGKMLAVQLIGSRKEARPVTSLQ